MTDNKNESLFNGRYLALLLINLVVSTSFSMVYTTMSSYVTGLGLSVTVAGTVTGAFAISSMVVRPITGVISDRMNRKKLLVAATALMGVSIAGYSLTTNTSVLIAFRIAHGVAFAISTTVNMAIIPGIVPDNRIGEAICYYGLSQSLASAVGPTVGISLANASGFGLTFAISAALCMVGALTAIPLRMTDDTDRSATARKRMKLSDLFVARCLPFTMIEITIASISGIENSLMVLYAATQGIDNIGWYFTISAVTVAISRLFFGKIIDRKGTFAVYPGIAMMIIGLIVLWQQSAPWMFAVAAVVKTLGASLAKPALQAASVKSVPPARRGAAVSTYYIGTDLGQGSAPIIGGKIVDMNGGDYSMVFALYALPLALATAAYYCITRHINQKAKAPKEVR